MRELPTSAKDNPQLYDASLLTHGIAFAAAADAYRSSAKVVDDFVLFFLIGRALELVLKAHVLRDGDTEKTLRSLGHRLEKALVSAQARGLDAGLDGHETNAIALLGHWYASKALEYPLVQGYVFPNARVIRTALDRVIRAVFVAKWGERLFEHQAANTGKSGLRCNCLEQYGPDPRTA